MFLVKNTYLNMFVQAENYKCSVYCEVLNKVLFVSLNYIVCILREILNGTSSLKGYIVF